MVNYHESIDVDVVVLACYLSYVCNDIVVEQDVHNVHANRCHTMNNENQLIMSMNTHYIELVG